MLHRILDLCRDLPLPKRLRAVLLNKLGLGVRKIRDGRLTPPLKVTVFLVRQPLLFLLLADGCSLLALLPFLLLRLESQQSLGNIPGKQAVLGRRLYLFMDRSSVGMYYRHGPILLPVAPSTYRLCPIGLPIVLPWRLIVLHAVWQHKQSVRDISLELT